MISAELANFIDKADAALKNAADSDADKLRAFGRMTKLTEETGELASAILAKYGYQRDVKLDEYTERELSHEIADVIITTLLLAKTLNVNVETALAEKIAKIEKRFENGIR